jgi:hypothetical protein
MEFKNYCIIVLGKTSGCVTEISEVAEGKINLLPAKGITIATFKTVFNVMELDDYFKSLGRNFFVFELNPETSGYNINNADVSENLFGHPNKDINLELEQMSNKIIEEIKSTSNTRPISGSSKNFTIEDNKTESELATEFYEGLSSKEKQKLMDAIIDKGVDNLTNQDKEILEILAKNT